MTAKRDYAKATTYENQPEQVANRVARNRARAQVEQKVGHKLGPHVDVDHKTPLKNGGTSATSNLRAISESQNSSWRKGSTGYKVKKV